MPFSYITLLSFIRPRYIFALSLLYHFSVLHFHLVIIPRRFFAATFFYGRELNLMSLKVFSHCHGPLLFPTYVEFERISCLQYLFLGEERDDIPKTSRVVQIRCPREKFIFEGFQHDRNSDQIVGRSSLQ